MLDQDSYFSQSATSFTTSSFSINQDINDYNCGICFMVVSEAQLCRKCESPFCKLCINSWLTKDNSCPYCRQQFQSHVSIKFNSKVKDSIFPCVYSENGCRKMSKGSHIRIHQEQCLYKNKKAGKEKCLDCELEVFEQDMEFH